MRAANDRKNLQDRRKSRIQLDTEPAISPRGGPSARWGPRGFDRSVLWLVDDPDDPTFARINDHTLVIHHCVAIFGVTRNGTKLDSGRQRLADNHPLPYSHRRRTFTLDRRDHGIGDFSRGTDRGAHGSADDFTDRTGNVATGGCPICRPRGGGGFRPSRPLGQASRRQEPLFNVLPHPALPLPTPSLNAHSSGETRPPVVASLLP